MSFLPDYSCDIFISYRHNDNRSGWVTEFVRNLQEELGATIKEPLTIYFDSNPDDGLRETHQVKKSLENKLNSIILIPVISQTYCDLNSYAWKDELCAFNKMSRENPPGIDVTLPNGNVASRILPVKIHDLDVTDTLLLEKELDGPLRAIPFIYKEDGVNRPLKATDERTQNQNKTDYRNQVNKVANAIKDILYSLRNPPVNAMAGAIHAPQSEHGRGRKKIMIIGSIVIAVILSGLLFVVKSRSKDKPNAMEKSIVVLPFVNMSNDANQDYFSDGLTEEIIDRLAKIRDLRVISRTSAMEYKKTNKHIPQIAQELNVSYILEGSVRRSSDHLRITFQLIKGADDEHIWSETIDRPLTGIFEAQHEIAMQLANYFQITLSESDKGLLNKIPTRFISAYDWYLKGNQLSAQRLDDNNRAIAYLKKAIKIDPEFSEAMGRLSYYYAKQGVDLNNGKQWLDTAYYYAAKGYELAPDSPVTTVSLGFVYFYQQRDSLALIYLRKANVHKLSLGLRPISNIFIDYGMLDSAFYYAEKLRTLEPLAPAYSQLAVIEMILGNLKAARLFTIKGVSLGGTPSSRDIVKYNAIDFYIRNGEYEPALKIIRDNFMTINDEAVQKTVSHYLFRIYFAQKDWTAFTKLLTPSDDEWRALMNQELKQPEFKTTISRLEGKNPQNKNLHLLKGDYKKILEDLRKIPSPQRYISYQSWMANPFARRFVSTPEFKRLFEGYPLWVQKMETSINRMRN